MRFIFALCLIFSFLNLPTFAMHSSSNEQVIFIMLGAPGAGKGTQSMRLSESFHIPQISTGDLFRDNLRRQTPIGLKAQAYMDAGKLVPDEIVLEMLFDRLKLPDCTLGYILDGFPRTIPQAQALDQRLCQTHAKIIVISLEVPDSVIIERLSGRLICEKCGQIYHKVTSPPKQGGICDRDGQLLSQRKDDTEAVIRDRLQIFHEQTEPVKAYFQAKGNLLLVDSSTSQEKTASQIDAYLKKALP